MRFGGYQISRLTALIVGILILAALGAGVAVWLSGGSGHQAGPGTASLAQSRPSTPSSSTAPETATVSPSTSSTVTRARKIPLGPTTAAATQTAPVVTGTNVAPASAAATGLVELKRCRACRPQPAPAGAVVRLLGAHQSVVLTVKAAGRVLLPAHLAAGTYRVVVTAALRQSKAHIFLTSVRLSASAALRIVAVATH